MDQKPLTSEEQRIRGFTDNSKQWLLLILGLIFVVWGGACLWSCFEYFFKWMGADPIMGDKYYSSSLGNVETAANLFTAAFVIFFYRFYIGKD